MNNELKAMRGVIEAARQCATPVNICHPVYPNCFCPPCKLKYELLELDRIQAIVEKARPEWYAKDKGGTIYKPGSDPEVTCWHCRETFLCDPMDACCRLCSAPYDPSRCDEFKFVPKRDNTGEDMSVKQGRFKTGDWVLHDYEIKQVTKSIDGAVTEVSCGSFCTSGNELICFPLTLENKRIAEEIAYWERELRKTDTGRPSLNWPDIHRQFCTFFEDAITTSDPKKRQDIQKQTREFVHGIIEEMGKSKEIVLNGVRVFGR